MGFFDSLSPRAVATSALLLTSFAQDVLARPSPDPKAPWVKNTGLGKKKMANHLKRAIMGDKRAVETPFCSETLATEIKAPKPNVWGPLVDVEVASVVEWLFAQADLNLTVSEEAGGWDNTIQLVEAMWPNKTDVLSFVDGDGPAPTKYAHVVLNNRATETPHYADIIVGPLPLDNATAKWEPLEYPYTKQNGGKVRNLDADSDRLYSEWLFKIGASVADITLDLWNGTAMGLENDTLSIWGIDPLWQDDGEIIRWDTFWNIPTGDFDDMTLFPLGLYFSSEVSGRDPSKWQLRGWLYNSIFYATTEEFRAAYWSEGFVKNGPNVDGDWARTDQNGEVPEMDKAQGPVIVAPAGARFAVDHKEKYVEWMDWSFYVGFNRDTGPGLFDIRYKGERLVYELSLQEALAHYAGNDPMNSGTAYLDSFYGFGPYTFELVKGYDCPAYATYMNTSFYVNEETRTHIDSLCLFEYVADYPMQRHTTSDYVSVTKNTYFVIRSIATIGNYDYQQSFSFFMDGSFAVEVRASGYIQSAYFAGNEDYGFKIHDNLSGSMHDHVLNFKADFDVLGTNNSIELMSMVPVSRSYPWSAGKVRNTMALERKFIETEDESRFNWGPNSATQVLIVNENEKNKHGELRGYRVLPYMGTAHLTVENSTNLGVAAQWANHDIQITKYKDSEQKAYHAFNTQDVHDPPVNFDKYFDGESVRNEDIVLWLNLGMHHVPHTGDLPNTVQTTAHSGIQFMPSNYFDIDQSRRTVNQVRINYFNGSAEVEEFGQFKAGSEEGTCGTCKLNYTPLEPEHQGYKGDVVIRKFPFDPNNPFYSTAGI
ncbi:putative copper amine oxidase [Cercophora samala]|uniref:Amine oxidase n=1 Tax=Cercophora samala TaxID=330535 RepID=A0AA40DD00_9PEZI|nr:putative copper amine oxidase [Cercophora samala]